MIDAQLSRRALFAALYYSEGAPIGFVWWAIPTLLAAREVPTGDIAQLAAVLVLPWTLKFLWAPLVDRCQTSRWTLKHWIATAQVVMGLLLLPLARLDFKADFELLRWLLLAHAIAAATQDVAIDAYCLKIVPIPERGGVNGWMQAGMLLGRSLLGGGALLVEPRLGQAGLIYLLVGNCWLSLPILWFAPQVEEHAEKNTSGTEPDESLALPRQIATVLASRRTWLTLLFACTAGAVFEAAGVLIQPTLISLGATQEDVGRFFLLVTTSCMAIGALQGGWLADRWPHAKALFATQGLLVLAALILAASVAYVESAAPPKDDPAAVNLMPAWFALALLYFAIGGFTAASYTLFMDVSRPPLAATRLSLFMGGTNACESWTAYVSGLLIAQLGYSLVVAAMALPTLLSLGLVLAITRKQQPPEVST